MSDPESHYLRLKLQDALYALTSLCEELNAIAPEREATAAGCMEAAADMRERCQPRYLHPESN